MKKSFNITALVFAAITLVASVLHLILSDDPALISWIIAVVLALSAVGMWLIPSFMKQKMLTLIPVLALLVVTDYSKTILTALLDDFSTQASVSLLPAYFDFETLGLLLTVAFVVAVVLALKKGCKWFAAAAAVYSAFLLFSQAQILLTYATAASAIMMGTKETIAMMLMVLSFLTAYAAQVTVFLGIGAEADAKKDADKE